MNDKDFPRTSEFSYHEFAIVEVTVTRETALDGNSGDSSVRINVDGGNIWVGEDPRGMKSLQDFTIRLSGENEHSILARAFRAAADELERN